MSDTEKPKSSLGKKLGIGALALVGLFVVLGSLGGTNNSGSSSTEPVTPALTATEANNPEPSGLSPAQGNAVRSAKQYLDMTGFSRDGLISQLSSDAGNGYALADATAAVDSLDVDWNEQAARSAKQYLEMTGFSCKGLISQLSSSAGSKYTESQAAYGAKQAGAC